MVQGEKVRNDDSQFQQKNIVDLDELMNNTVNTAGKGALAIGGVGITGTAITGLRCFVDGGFVAFCNSLGKYPWIYRVFQIQNTYTPWLCSWFPQAACVGLSGLSVISYIYLIYKFVKYLEKHNYNVTDIAEKNYDTIKKLFIEFVNNKVGINLEPYLANNENANVEE